MYSDQKIIKKRKSVQIPSRITRDYSPTQYQRYSHIPNDFLTVDHQKQIKNLRYTFSAKTLKYLDIVQTPPLQQQRQRQCYLQRKSSFQNLRLAVLELENKLHLANNQMFKKKTNGNVNTNGINNNNMNTNKLMKTKQKPTAGFRNNQFYHHQYNNNNNFNNNMNTHSIYSNYNNNINSNYNHNNHILTSSSLRPNSNLHTMRPNTQYEYGHQNYQNKQFDFYGQTFCNQQKEKEKEKEKEKKKKKRKKKKKKKKSQREGKVFLPKRRINLLSLQEIRIQIILMTLTRNRPQKSPNTQHNNRCHCIFSHHTSTHTQFHHRTRTFTT